MTGDWVTFYGQRCPQQALKMMVWADGAHDALLDRCWWGRLKVERYPSEDVEMQQYQLAMEVV